MKTEEKASLEALRKRFYLRGSEGIGDEDLLAMVIGACNHRSTGAIAQELVERYGGLDWIAEAGI